MNIATCTSTCFAECKPHELQVTRERIRQIEAKAIRKLRQPSRNSVLQEYAGVIPRAQTGPVPDARSGRYAGHMQGAANK